MINEMSEGYPKQGKTLEEHSAWQWREGRDGNLRVYAPDGQGEHSGLIAVVFKGHDYVRLIALAPDLLEILRQAVKARNDEPERYVYASCSECTEGSLPLKYENNVCWYHRALRAIARAEGK